VGVNGNFSFSREFIRPNGSSFDADFTPLSRRAAGVFTPTVVQNDEQFLFLGFFFFDSLFSPLAS